MKNLSTTQRIGLLLSVPVVIGVAALITESSDHGKRAAAAPDKEQDAPKPAVTFNAQGELLRPTGYRKWMYVGAPLTPNDMNGGKAAFPEFHSVYISPDAYDRYEKTGEFPEGTVVVKELLSVGSKKAPSGNGYFMGEFTGLEVAIKDKARFQDEPGNWAYFSFGHEYPLKSASRAQPTANCNACHSIADDDYVFTQYYPVLRAAKRSAKASR